MDIDIDRLSFVPPHAGSNVLPNLPLFSKLLIHATLRNSVCIKEVEAGHSVQQFQLLTDVLSLRNTLLTLLDSDAQRKLRLGEELWIGLLAPGGYEWAVGFLAIIALGAAVVPLSPAYPTKELSYYVRKSKAEVLLMHHSLFDRATELKRYMNITFQTDITLFSLAQSIFTPPMAAGDILISSDQELDSSSAGVVIFTSGTTGPPKGAVMRRRSFGSGAEQTIQLFGISYQDVVMHCLPVHHATGILATFVPFMLAGGCVEFYPRFDVQVTWERWIKGGVTYFSGVPTIYTRMVQFYEREIQTNGVQAGARYASAAQNFKALLCGTAALPRPLRLKWLKLTGGKPIMERYGGSEFGGVFMTMMGDQGIPDGSIGKLVPGVDAKLSDGDEGEVLVRQPGLFSRYLYDPDATRKAHTEDGYFKTGDVARREGEYYFILGRSSIDILKSGGYKISALDIEREILSLDYVSEVIVVGVPDKEFGQRVAAAIVLVKDFPLTIDQLRNDLSQELARYKLPTLLCVVGELEKTLTGKVMKRAVGKALFESHQNSKVQVWNPNRTAKVARL